MLFFSPPVSSLHVCHHFVNFIHHVFSFFTASLPSADCRHAPEADRGAARTAQVSLSKLGNAALLDDALLCADFEQLLLNFPSADQPHASSSSPVAVASESDQPAAGGDAPSNATSSGGANWAAAAEKAAATAPGAAFKAGQAAGEHAQAEVAAKIAAKAAAKIGASGMRASDAGIQ